MLEKEMFSFKTVMNNWAASLKFYTEASRWRISKFSVY